MENVQLAFFEFFALLIAIPLSYVLAYLVKRFSANSYEAEVLKLFSFYWNGEPEDEIYAWMKVRSILKDREDSRKKIHYVNRKIESLNKQPLYGTWKVNGKGELLTDRHIQE